jgi:hypothetical protein
MDEEELAMLKGDLESEEHLQVTIAELIGSLFKTHPQLSEPLVEVVFK